MVRKLVLAVAAASALMSSGVVLALGVGDINLRSSLNQPLDAEIELLQVRDLSSQEIISVLATPDEFGRAGIERIFFLNDLTFTPVVRPDGKSVIRVTSSRPVREPFLNFLMEVRWPSGRVLREFTLLLDPPLYDPVPVVASAPISQPRIQPQVQPVRPAPVQPAPARPPRSAGASSAIGAAPAEPLYQAPAASSTQPSAPAASASQAPGQIRTSQADTLWEIALRNRPQGASVHQTMLAIQDLNPDAFIGDNINRLRAGQNLDLPDVSQANSRSQAEAVRQVAAQNASWQQGRQTAEPAQRQLDARRLDEAAAAPQNAREGDSLRLVGSGDEQGAGGADAGARNGEGQLRDELDTTKEELDSVRREKAEAESRLADMQSQMETLQRLLELKDEQLAAMQQAVGEAPAAGDATEAPVVSAPEPAASDASIDEQGAGDAPLAADEDLIVGDSEMSAEADAIEPLEAPMNEEQSPVAADAAVQSVPAPAEPELAEPSPAEPEEVEPVAVVEEQPAGEQELGLLQRMMQNQTLLLAGGGLVLLLLLLALMAIARRNARREEDMADNFIARAAQNNDAVGDEDDQFNVALAGYQEESQAAHAEGEDPMVEADALIAYGKLGKAADVLTTALEREPDRTDLRLKLMEVDGLLDDAEGYAEQEAVLRRDGTVDNQVDMLNVRFPAMAAAIASAAVSAEEYPEWDEDFLQDAIEANATTEQGGHASGAAEAPAESEAPKEEYDFSGFDVEPEPAPRQEPVAEENLDDFDLDFDLDDSLAESLAQADEPTPAITEKLEDDFEFDFNLDEPAAEAPAVKPVDEEEFTLDEDFDLSLTDDLDVAEPGDAAPQAKPDTELEPLEEEQTVELSDADLEAFEAELEASMSEPAAEDEADEIQRVESADTPSAPQATDADEGDDDEFDFLSGTDESATKLDLARAYIDMGDQEGARDILNEVIEEGNDQQQQEARDMMGQLD
ncbi:MAG: FimV family protein [Pseudomonas sp.]|nr:FimV family protein [Pseudomonas sp.]